MVEGTRYKCKNCNYSFNRDSYSNDARCPYCSKVDTFARVGVRDNVFREL